MGDFSVIRANGNVQCVRHLQHRRRDSGDHRRPGKTNTPLGGALSGALHNPNLLPESALVVIADLPVLEKLHSCITYHGGTQLSQASGSEGIPAEVLKKGKPALLQQLRELFSLFWEKDYVPRHKRDSKIITLQKNKGDRRDCNNYQGISLLSIAGKAFQTSTQSHSVG